MLQAFLPISLALASCGSAEERSPMEGDWKSGDLASEACAQTWNFNVDFFDLSVYCQLDNGQVGLQVTRGIFTVLGDRITLIKTRSTCANDTREPLTLTFLVERTKLTLTSTTNVYTLARGALSLRPGASARFGCFDGMGFTESELRDLP